METTKNFIITSNNMKNKIINFRSPYSVRFWIFRRNMHFSRYVLYNHIEDEEINIQNTSIILDDNELPIFDCYSKDNNSISTYLLITTHFLTSIVDNKTFKVEIEDVKFYFNIEDILLHRKSRVEYFESIKYELKSTEGIIPIWIENGNCENIIWGIFKQLNFLKEKYEITND